ncbi:hypothetical protein Gogos_002140 [Gossypium gossypioides]|uniref:Uncharacterized protein n=1 Tax=Gossypium gossypioides TaxID=34282 RepID=A0A7J9CQS1_GOSGO|nr:hypothetical protein [Gossypium gossypioides]
MDFLNISSTTYYNLVRAFFSNAKLEHKEPSDTVITITSFLKKTPIRLTLEEFGDYLHFPSGDVEGAFEDILTPEHASPPTSSSQATQPSSQINGVILDAIHSLSNDIQGLRDEVRSHRV